MKTPEVVRGESSASRTAAPRPLRLALLLHMAPRKLGSMEDWMIGFVHAAQRCGHSVDVFGQEPIHPQVLRGLLAGGACWGTLKELLSNSLRAVLRMRQYDVVHLSFFDPSSRMISLACLAWPARVLMADHLSWPSTRPLTWRSVVKARLRAAPLFRRIHSIAGVSNYVSERDGLLYGVPPARRRTIYDGVSLTRFSRDRPPLRDPSTFEILTVAYLIPFKGVDLLMSAVAQLDDPRVRLAIAGDGPDEQALRNLARSLGIEGHTKFLGLRHDVEELMRQADLFVHPAVWYEAFGLVIAEAMASECPVIASRIGGVPEVIVDGESGILVEPGNVPELKAAIRRLITDPALRARLGANARTRVSERFGLDRCVQEHLAWCEQAAGITPRSSDSE